MVLVPAGAVPILQSELIPAAGAPMLGKAAYLVDLIGCFRNTIGDTLEYWFGERVTRLGRRVGN